MADKKVKFELVDDAPADSALWKSWEKIIRDEEWATDEHATTNLEPRLSTTKSVFAVLKEDKSYIASVVWNEFPETKLVWIGFFNCEKKYRGLGIALEAWKRAMERMPEGWTVGLKAALAMEAKYQSRDMTHKAGEYWKFEPCLPDQVLDICKKTITIDKSELKIRDVLSLNEDEWRKVKEFDRKIAGWDRTEWLELYRNFEEAHSCAIFDSNDNVVCYASIVRTCHYDTNRYKLAPVYADNLQLALLGIQCMAEWVKEQNKDARICMFVVDDTIGQSTLAPLLMNNGNIKIDKNGTLLYTKPYANPTDTTKVFLPYNNQCGAFDI